MRYYGGLNQDSQYLLLRSPIMIFPTIWDWKLGQPSFTFNLGVSFGYNTVVNDYGERGKLSVYYLGLTFKEKKMKKLIMMLLMIGFGYSQSLPQPIIVGEELDYPTLKISQFVKVDESVGIRDDKVSLGIKQLVEESFQDTRYRLVEDDNLLILLLMLKFSILENQMMHLVSLDYSIVEIKKHKLILLLIW